MRIEYCPTTITSEAAAIVQRGEDLGAARAKDHRLRLFGRIGMLGKYVGVEQVDVTITDRALKDLDPEIIKNVAEIAVSVLALI